MKKISKSDLRGLAERFPMYSKEIMRTVIGGYSLNEMEQILMTNLGSSGTTYTDSNGNSFWDRSGYAWADI
jgi:hypothetical protein